MGKDGKVEPENWWAQQRREYFGFHRLKQTNRANKKTNQKTKNKKTQQKEQNKKKTTHRQKNKKRQKRKTTEENAGLVFISCSFFAFYGESSRRVVFLVILFLIVWFFRLFANISWGLKGKSMKCDGKNHGFRLRFSLKPIQWEHSAFPFPRRIRWWRTYWPRCWSRRWAQFQGGGATENGMTSYNSTTKGRFFTLFDVSSLIFFPNES